MITDFDNYLSDVNRRFTTENISVDRDWLVGCVEFFLSETPQISKETLYKQAFEQWLLSDLAEIGEKCLPDTLQHNKNEFKLNGKFPLQLQYLIDIAEPAYDQLRNLYNQKLDEPNEEPEQRKQNVSKKKRMLKLELTDGHISAIAMERSPIPCLNTKLSPGSKILLKGPMRCVNKVIFLEPENVKILGGEVEKLLVENAFENVLLKALGRPVNPNPKLEYQETVVQQIQSKPNMVPMPIVFNNPTSNTMIHDDDDELFSNIDTDLLNQNAAPNQIQNLLDDDDDIFLDANIPDAVPKQSVVPTNQRPLNCNPVLFDDDSFDEIDMTEVENEMRLEMLHEEEEQRRCDEEERRKRFNEEEKKKSATVNQPPGRASIKNVELFDQADLDAIFNSDDDSFQAFSSRIIDNNYEFKIAGSSLVTIDQLNAIPASEKKDKSFVVKCEIDSVVEKIQIKNNRWHLGVLVEDSCNQLLQVRFSNEIMTDLADTTAEEITKMRSVLHERPQLRKEAENVLINLHEKLRNLHCFMKVKYISDNEPPEVIELINSQPDFEEILKTKLAKGSVKLK